MIQRFVCPGLSGTAVLAALCYSSLADAFCRTTTCAHANAPASCVRDPETGCWTEGKPLEWEQPCVSYSVVAGGVPTLGFDEEAARAIVSAGFSMWPNVECGDGFPSIALSSTDPISCAEPEYNPEGPNANAVIFREHDWPHDAFALALTTVSFNAETGKLFDADMEINVFGQLLFESSLEYVVAHEAGHFLGLDHSSDAEALMFERYSPFANGGDVELTADDQAGICRAYPPARETPSGCDPEPERGFAPECGGDIEGSCSLSPTESPARVPLATLAFFACALLGRRVATGVRFG